MKIPLIRIDGQDPTTLSLINKRVIPVLHSGHFILGENVHALEKEIAAKVDARYAVAVASGSDALYLSLLALGIGPGDEVITTPFTFFATAGSIARAGATPVFVDIDPQTFNLDPGRIEKSVTRKTKAILPVHLFGLACDMNAIRRIARKRGLCVVEDAAQSFGATYEGRMTGSLGDAGCYSFYPTKNLGGAGDGGMVVTSSKRIAAKIRFLRDHGQTKKYHHEWVGLNSRLDELQAAVLRVKLGFIDKWNRQRRFHAAEYSKNFAALAIQTPVEVVGRSHAFHLYSILTPRRDELAASLAKNGIGAGIYYPLPLHLQPCFKKLRYKLGDFPVAERAGRQILSLPIYANLTAEERAQVIARVKNYFKKF